VPRVGAYHDDILLEWVAGFDLLSGAETLVPLNCVVCPYEGKVGPSIFVASSNGLASGNSRTEALCHALCEVIERDAEAIAMARTRLGPAARQLIGLPEEGDKSAPRQIALKRLPPRAASLVSKIRKAGLEVFLQDISGTAGIAAVYCTIVDPFWQGAPNVHGGCGAHPDARVALLRALTEAAQSRIACIQGGREDLPHILCQKSHCDVGDAADLFARGKLVFFEDIPSYEHEYIDEDVELLLSRLPESGIDQAIAFDMTDPRIGIPVVRVVIPRAETWAVFHLHTGRGVLGPRVAKEL
jgi:ribosomal protein S12 methylthiotransferase accessory factor